MVRERVHQMSEKQLVRAEVLAARRAMRAKDRFAADRALAEAAAGLVGGLQVVAAYAPMPGEPGGPDLLDALAGAVTTVLLPVLLPDRDLDWAAYRGRDQLSQPGTDPDMGSGAGPEPGSATGEGTSSGGGPELGSGAGGDTGPGPGGTGSRLLLQPTGPRLGLDAP